MIKLTDLEKNKIENLNEDIELVEAIKKVLLNAFLTEWPTNNKDFMTLAASRVAIDILKIGFYELEKIRKVEEKHQDNKNPAR